MSQISILIFTSDYSPDITFQSIIRLGDTIQNIDISMLNSLYLESISIFKIEFQHQYHSHAYLYDIEAKDMPF